MVDYRDLHPVIQEAIERKLATEGHYSTHIDKVENGQECALCLSSTGDCNCKIDDEVE